MPIHPKTSAAALGGALGLLIVAVLGSIHGVSLSAEADAAIPAFLSSLGSWLSPSPDPAPVPDVTSSSAVLDAIVAEAEKRVQAQFNELVATLPQPPVAPAPLAPAPPLPPAA